jgi:ribosomal protein S12
MQTDNVDAYIVAIGKELIESQNKIINTPNIPNKELRNLLKIQSENMGVLQWLQEIKAKVNEHKPVIFKA